MVVILTLFTFQITERNSLSVPNHELSLLNSGIKFDSSGMYVLIIPAQFLAGILLLLIFIFVILICLHETRVTVNNSRPVYASSEKEVFDILDLPWIDPTMRNADF